MNQESIDRLETPAYSSPLRPGVVRDLGPDAQVWGLEIAVAPTNRKRLLAVALHNGQLTLELPWGAFAEGPRGIRLQTFSAAVYGALRGAGVALTKKTRLLLYTFDSTPRYSALDLYDLDERIAFNPGGSNFSVHYHDKTTHENLEIVDIQSFFPDRDLSTVLGNFSVPAPEAYTPIRRAKRPGRADADRPEFLTWAADHARAYHALITAMRAKLLEHYPVDPAVYRTPASLSARVYVSQYLSKPVGAIRHPIRLQAMRSYWGGRMEAFARGTFTGDLSMYDAVSMYPSAAIQLGELPTEFSWFRLSPGNMEICRGGLCRVEFQFPADELHPCLPVYALGRMYYPLAGTSDCTLHEVRYALELGAKITLVEGWGYVNGERSLAAYSRDLLARKHAAGVAGDTSGREMYKLLINSLYGKFGQQRVEFDLNELRAVCRRTGWPDLNTLMHIPNWQQVAGDMLNGGEGPVIKEKIRMGGQWAPEWAALIQGYARTVESRAMREYVALTGTTDSILIDGDAGDEFEIMGVTFRRVARGTRATVIRSRLYALDLGNGGIKCALHGAPNIEGMPEKILNWNGQEELPVTVQKVKGVRDGLMDGHGVGHAGPGTWRVSCRWDDKRQLVDTYSEPFPVIG